jgi:hypothetical protein
VLLFLLFLLLLPFLLIVLLVSLFSSFVLFAPHSFPPSSPSPWFALALFQAYRKGEHDLVSKLAAIEVLSRTPSNTDGLIIPVQDGQRITQNEAECDQSQCHAALDEGSSVHAERVRRTQTACNAARRARCNRALEAPSSLTYHCPAIHWL